MESRVYHVYKESKSAGIYYIIPSGWKDMFHVIYEDPTEGDYHCEHKFMKKEDVIEMFGAEV